MLKSTLTAAALSLVLAAPALADDDDWRGRGYDRDDRRGHRHDDRRDDRRDHWRQDGRRHHDWRGDRDWRRHDNWRVAPWREHRRWRHVPPVRYRADFDYRSGYELAWRDWHRHGRNDRYWRRSRRGHGIAFGYWAGYDAGWRDAAHYYGRGYRPGYWAYDPRDGWFFGFHISG